MYRHWACILVMSSVAAAETLYLSTTGQDAVDGGRTLSTALRTFGHAIPRLGPGDTLLVAPGTYLSSDGGTLSVNCAATAQNGTPDASVTVRAMDERMSILVSEGRVTPLSLNRCGFWNVIGFTVINIDSVAGSQSAVALYDSNHLLLDRMLIQGNNRLAAYSAAIDLADDTDITVQDSEIYDFSGIGMNLWNNTNVTVRRVYFNSRGRASPDSGVIDSNDGDRTRGDIGMTVTGQGHVLENIISEGQVRGFLFYSPNTRNVDLIGSVSVSEGQGLLLYGATPVPVSDIRVSDFAAVHFSSSGIRSVNGRRIRVSNASFIDGQTDGLRADTVVASDAGVSIEVDSSLALNVGQTGFSFANQDEAFLRSSNAFQCQTPWQGTATVTGLTTRDPQLGSCLVYLPASSPLKSSAPDGGDIGASILFRSVDGRKTTTPLWDPVTGQFPCGAVVPGINDIPDASCRDVHLRLEVGTPGCPLPYAPLLSDGGAPDAGACDGGTCITTESDGGRQPAHLTVGCACQPTSQFTPAFWGIIVLILATKRIVQCRCAERQSQLHGDDNDTSSS